MRLHAKIRRHLLRGAVMAGGLSAAGGAEGAIIHSGIVNLPIPVNIDGVYLNLVTGATASAEFAGYDINPYSATGLSWFYPSAPSASHGLVRGLGTSTTQIDNLFGTGYEIGATGTPAPNYGGGSNQTTGPTAFVFNSENNIVGLRFFNESTGAVNYGWMRIGLGTSFTDSTRRIVEWAYENTGAPIVAGSLPLPNVTVFLNPSFVQNCGDINCEGTNTVNELAAIGCDVASFAEFTPSNLQAMFAAGRVLVIPEQEVGSLYASLSAATREAFRNAVLAGGRVLVFGTADSRASEIINLLLGSSMSHNANAIGSTAALNTTSVAGTPFVSSPATLNGPDATWLAGPWPSTALIAYGSSASAWCAASPAGTGRVGFIAYDVWNPSQASAAAWRTVMDRMLRHLGPSVGNVDADGDGVPDAGDNCPAVANPSQVDCDSDGLGDACETDPDVNLNGIRDNCETGSLVFAVPQHFTTVGSAIAAATPGSIVRVAPGTYPERINFAGKAITVESTAGAASTILDGGGLPVSIVSFLSGEGPGSVLRGFTVRNGQGGSPLPQAPAQYVVGGGIHVNLSSPTIEDCIIEDCFAPWGGGVTVYRSSAVLRRCTFRDNLATGGGGLLLFRAYGALVEDCLLEDNRAAEGGGIFSSYGSSTVRTSDFLGNESEGEGSAIHYRYIDPEPTEPPSMLVQDCIIRTNSSDILGAAVLSQPTPPVATLSIQDSEICDNVARAIIGPYVDLGGNLICECPADANLDGTVNANDLAFVLGFWGPCAAACAADIDRDGSVDANDLAEVLGSWGTCP